MADNSNISVWEGDGEVLIVLVMGNGAPTTVRMPPDLADKTGRDLIRRAAGAVAAQNTVSSNGERPPLRPVEDPPKEGESTEGKGGGNGADASNETPGSEGGGGD